MPCLLGWPRVASAMPSAEVSPFDLALADEVSAFYADPLGFVLTCFPWGEPGLLEAYQGPDVWQRNYLEELGREVQSRQFDGVHAVPPIRMGVSSGHGIGKGALAAWLILWLMSTRPNAKGTITANTQTQLDDKTWAGLLYWKKLCLTGHWFEANSSILYRVGSRESWRCSPQSSKEENSEAFAGQHNANSTSFYVFDEGSAIPDEIFKVAEGGLTDGEPMIFIFGNPTRNTGAFHRALFGAGRDRWLGHVIDSRTCLFGNQALAAEWLADYGEDSDFFRVRVRGLPPLTSALQFIDPPLVEAAQRRLSTALLDEPLIAGVDVSGGGAAWTVVRFRRGMDARTLDPIRIPGSQSKLEDRQTIVARLAAVLNDESPERRVSAMFVDSAFGAPLVERLHALGHDHVHEINFGGASPNAHQANQRAYQWNAMKEWLPRAALPPLDHRLATDLCGPGFHLNKADQLVLESKESMQKRGVASPDDGDALSLTWAQPIAVTLGQVPAPYRPRGVWT